MIYKVLYQESKDQAPRRETTETLYMEAENSIEARATIQANTNYNIELIQELTGNHLDYEQKSANYHLTEFTNEKTDRQE